MTAPVGAFDLGRLLEHIARHGYDAGHGLLPERQWVLDAAPLLDCLAQLAGLSPGELGSLYDQARFHVAWERVLAGGRGASVPMVHLLAEWLAGDRADPEVFLRERLGK